MLSQNCMLHVLIRIASLSEVILMSIPNIPFLYRRSKKSLKTVGCVANRVAWSSTFAQDRLLYTPGF